MNKVLQWITEFALADAGLQEQDFRHAVQLNENDLAQLIHKQGVSHRPTVQARNVLALQELLRSRHNMDEHQFRETMTTSDFPLYFGNALSRMFYKDYEYQTGDWKNYTTPDTTPDTRNVDRLRMSEPGTLHKRREKQQLAATYITETQISYGVEEYGEQFDVSWQTIQNDDMGKIKETPQRMVGAATRWADSWVSALYDNATTQAALIALGAIYGGTGRFTAPNLAIGINAMMQRVDVRGNPLNLRRINLVIPPILLQAATTTLKDVLAYGGAGGNVTAEFVSGIYVDPYIATALPNVPWYLFADPKEIPTVTVARMQGWPGPVASMRRSDRQLISGSAPAAFLMGDMSTGNIVFDVVDVMGGWDDATYVGVTDFRGIYYSNGTTA